MSKPGINAERELVHLLWDNGFAVMRAPVSGGATKMPRPDLIAGKSLIGKIYAIELKVTKANRVYLEQKEVDDLIFFAKRFGAEPLICVKFKGKRLGYLFIKPELLRRTKNGNYVVDLDFAISRGDDITAISEGIFQQRFDDYYNNDGNEAK